MTFRILSLDGGGTWSIIQILTLIDLYRSGGALLSGHHVLRDFDLVVANSGGSLVLGGLLKDLPLGEIAKYFDEAATRRAIFAPPTRRGAGRRLRRAMAGVAPRYSTPGKLTALRNRLNSEAGEPGLGDITLDALRTRTRLPTHFVITAFDDDLRRRVLFRSNSGSRAASFGTPAIATLAEAIHASTTAPIDFFDAPAVISRGRRCWDGALAGLSNPVMVGIAEALANGVEREAIQILSLGSGSVVLPLAAGNEDPATAKLVQQRPPARAGNDLRRLAGALIEDPVDDTSLLAHLALGQPVPKDREHPVSGGALVRLNPLVQPIRTVSGWVRPAGLIEAEDEGDEFARLRQMPGDAAEDSDIALLRKFTLLWHNDAVPNQPIRENPDTLECEIGHRWYSEARAHWQRLLQAPAGSAISATAQAPPATPPRNQPPPRLSSPKGT